MLTVAYGSVCSQPDPAGARLAMLRKALEQLTYIEGLFFVRRSRMIKPANVPEPPLDEVRL